MNAKSIVHYDTYIESQKLWMDVLCGGNGVGAVCSKVDRCILSCEIWAVVYN